ncbi:unnamed protein product [Rotaria socialis]|uniref:Pentapeptide repeat-containing protein n=1 Tax=Rotaria socialis TaxID=392032 RepID=A0A821E5I3_9BILA|nr:unnamed protein product [Rotaria socialis]
MTRQYQCVQYCVMYLTFNETFDTLPSACNATYQNNECYSHIGFNYVTNLIQITFGEQSIENSNAGPGDYYISQETEMWHEAYNIQWTTSKHKCYHGDLCDFEYSKAKILQMRKLTTGFNQFQQKLASALLPAEANIIGCLSKDGLIITCGENIKSCSLNIDNVYANKSHQGCSSQSDDQYRKQLGILEETSYYLNGTVDVRQSSVEYVCNHDLCNGKNAYKNVIQLLMEYNLMRNDTSTKPIISASNIEGSVHKSVDYIAATGLVHPTFTVFVAILVIFKLYPWYFGPFPLIFGIFTVVFTLKQDSIARINREHDQSLANELRKQTVYDTYIDDISRLLLRRDFNRSDSSYLKIIRTKTLSTLRQLEIERKREIILFLYENELIQNNKCPIEELVALDNGDLIGIEFKHSMTFRCELVNLYLASILVSNIIFNDCQLRNADFNGASMVQATFNDSIMSSGNFMNSDLTGASFNENNMRNIKFAGATLTRARICNSILEQVDFTNADLIESNANIDQLMIPIGEKANIFINTRFPNGSFSAINRSQLILDGSAEEMCTTKTTPWKTAVGFENVTAINTGNESSTPLAPIDGHCFFNCSWNSQAEQLVHIQHFSLLIDNEQAWYNLSAHFACISTNQNDKAYVQIEYVTDENADIDSVRLESDKGLSSFHFKYQIGLIPSGARDFSVNIGADIERTSTNNISAPYCAIDSVTYFIFKKEDK